MAGRLTDDELRDQGLEAIDWPSTVLDLECPDCTTPMEVPVNRWMACPDPECGTELCVRVSGVWRRREPEKRRQ